MPPCDSMPNVPTRPRWIPFDPEELLVIDTSKGRLMVEMRPELAPRAVERIKLLTREGVYDGLQFHRVIESYVAQTGNPDNRDGGVSQHPNLAPEFSAELPVETPWRPVVRTSEGWAGFLGTMPVFTNWHEGKETFTAWGAYCPGVAGMGRGPSVDSANSEIFFVRGLPAFQLGLRYTAWGNTVIGRDVISAVAVGEPPVTPDVMERVRVAADMPEAERPLVEKWDIQDPAFGRWVETIRREKGEDFTLSDLRVPTRLRTDRSA